MKTGNIDDRNGPGRAETRLQSTVGAEAQSANVVLGQWSSSMASATNGNDSQITFRSDAPSAAVPKQGQGNASYLTVNLSDADGSRVDLNPFSQRENGYSQDPATSSGSSGAPPKASVVVEDVESASAAELPVPSASPLQVSRSPAARPVIRQKMQDDPAPEPEEMEVLGAEPGENGAEHDIVNETGQMAQRFSSLVQDENPAEARIESDFAQDFAKSGPEIPASGQAETIRTSSAGSDGDGPVVEAAPPSIEPWVETILLAARTLGVQTSPELVRSASVWAGEARFQDAIIDIAMSAGLSAQFVEWEGRDLSRVVLPVLVPISSKYVGLVVSIVDGIVNLVVPVSGKIVERSLPVQQLSELLRHPVLLVREREVMRDGRLDDFMTFKPKTWLRDIFITNWRTISELCVGSFFGNLLAVGTSLFAMQVWDRVVPARSTETLWVLASGVIFALMVEFCIRTARVTLADHFGKRADLKLSAMFFARALDIKSDARPRSPGTLISQLRDLDQMRELLTSSTMGVIIDLPFVFLFLFIIWLIGGYLVWVPVAAVPIMLITGIVLQIPLANLADKGLSEAALRNALLMETVHRVEDIKILQAEPRFRNLWNKVNRVSADISMKQRFLGSLLMNLTATVQQLAYIGVVIAGVYGIMDGNLSFGAVLACSILTSRTIAPLGQISAIFSRLQNARVSKKALDGLMQLPVDHDREKEAYHKPHLVGSYRFEKVAYSYDPEEQPILTIPSLKIEPGEKIAILGRVGAGKTTLLRLAGGLAQPQQGRILFNNVNMNLIDVSDVRRDVGFLMQDSSLFYGTLRDNLLLGNPLASDEEVLEAMRISCADQLLLNQPRGLDLVLREGGKGLSGGQKQTLMMARMVLRSPNVLLMDEPTASLDEATEVGILSNLKEWLGRRTLIVATHRYAVLSLVERIIVVDGGRIVLDGAKEDILRRLREKHQGIHQSKPDAAVTDAGANNRIENNG